MTWLTVPDFAEALGTTPSEVRDLLRECAIVGVRRGPREVLHLPADFIVEQEGEPRLLSTLRGTLTLLRDAGFTDDEAVEWLVESCDELGCPPLQALREGRRAPVRRVAQELL